MPGEAIVRVVHPFSTWALLSLAAKSSDPDVEDSNSMVAWIGIGLNLLGCSVGCMGWLMQKFAHNEANELEEKSVVSEKSKDGKPEEEEDKSEKRGCCCSFCPDFFQNPLWLMGLCVFISGQIITAVSLGLAPQTIASTLNCFTIIITFCVAPFFLGEQIIVWRVVCVMVMVCGCSSVMANGPHSFSEFTVFTLRESLKDPWTVFIVLLIAGGSIGSYLFMKRNNREPSVTQYCFYAAATSWFSVLTTKVLMSLIWTMILDGTPDQLQYIDFWVALVLVACLAPSNVILMNLALQAGDATIVVPTYDALAMCGQIVLGGFFFQEFEQMDMHQAGGFVFGVTVVIAGVYLISQDPPAEMEFMKQPLFSVAQKPNKKKMARDEAKAPLKENMAEQPAVAAAPAADAGTGSSQA
eukprot:gnl/TRDRNA2_/TRDRNA2_178772_c0_seq1.p1 gnl/TRDRNA2_/TRDRNA2_178772_c0~~gnl/TRDRNA2_/TRDRNA2_178772_c0_seq1.p1  ORF type:complete len:448 (+),score=107.20 gnl/TRDRNA2_/TRDRNA2_178772_c0_seq1:113-1345(+)